MMKKKLIVLLIVATLIVLLFPIPWALDDGGTVLYDALLYEYYDVKRLVSPADYESGKMYEEGTELYILDYEVYSNVK